jgi:organic radical activating enzyme
MTYCLRVTNKCNWKCDYCISDTHNDSREYETAIELIQTIPENSDVALSGGEPGLLSTDQLLKIINLLKIKNCKISIKSNGQIFKHPDVLDRIDFVTYHCSENLDLDDYIFKLYRNTEYLVVVTDDNIHKLQNFLNKHNDIDIQIIPSKFIKPLSKKNLIFLYRNFKKYLKDPEDLFKTIGVVKI